MLDPLWTWVTPALACVLLALKFAHIVPSDATLVLTLFVGTLTLGTGRTSVLQGAIHLVIFAVFLLISAVP